MKPPLPILPIERHRTTSRNSPNQGIIIVAGTVIGEQDMPARTNNSRPVGLPLPDHGDLALERDGRYDVISPCYIGQEIGGPALDGDRDCRPKWQYKLLKLFGCDRCD